MDVLARSGFRRNEQMLSLKLRYVIAFQGNGVTERLVIDATRPASALSITGVRPVPLLLPKTLSATARRPELQFFVLIMRMLSGG